MTLTKKIAFNSSIQFIGRIIGILLSALLLVFLTRYLGTEKYGYYTTILAFVAIFNLFAEFGINQIVIQEISHHPKKRTEILSAAFFLKIVVSFIIFAVPPIIAAFLPYPIEIKVGILIAALATFPLTISTLFGTIFQIYLKTKYSVIASILSRALILLLSLGFIFTHQSIYYFFFAILAGNCLEFVISYFYARSLEKIHIKFNKTYIQIYKRIFLASWPMAVAIGLGTLAFKIDTIMLSLLKTQEAVGIYGVPYKIVDILITIPGIFMGLVMPVLASYYIKNKNLLKRSVQKSFDALIVVAFYVFVVVFLMAPYIINIVAGSSFSASTVPLRILIFAIVITFIQAPFPAFLIASGYQKKLIWRNLLALIFNVLINLVLIPLFSYNGAAVATVITEVLTMFFSLYLTYQVINFIPSVKRLFSNIAAGAISFVIGYTLIKFNIFISWSGFARYSFGSRILAFFAVFAIVSFFYFIFLVIFKGIDRKILSRLIPIKNIGLE